MKKIIFTTSLITMVLLLNNSCKKSITDYAASASCTGLTPTYTTSVATIINASCASSGCHSAASAKAGYNLADYTNASMHFKNHKELLASIHHDSKVQPMPQGGTKLSDSLIKILDCWTKNGCPQ